MKKLTWSDAIEHQRHAHMPWHSWHVRHLSHDVCVSKASHTAMGSGACRSSEAAAGPTQRGPHCAFESAALIWLMACRSSWSVAQVGALCKEVLQELIHRGVILIGHACESSASDAGRQRPPPARRWQCHPSPRAARVHRASRSTPPSPPALQPWLLDRQLICSPTRSRMASATAAFSIAARERPRTAARA